MLDANGTKLRGEDYGLAALEIEISWTPEDAEYATRLSNIGNVHRILGDMHSSKTGGVSDLKKMEQSYQLAEQFLEEALASMKTAMSVAPQEKANALLETLNSRHSYLKRKDECETVDGSRTLKYCVVLENMALLNQAQGYSQAFPKGTPETVKAKFENAWRTNRVTAIQRINQAMEIRKHYNGTRSQEYWTLLQSLIEVHMYMKDYHEALPLQVEIPWSLSRLVHFL